MVPVFALPQLGVAQSVGLLMTVGFPLLSIKAAIAFSAVWTEEKQKKTGVSERTFGFLRSLVTCFILYPLVLLFAFVASLFL